ncbi:MAG: cation diffusion facilitator family transporter [Alloacidobacterium sp.]|jgi:cation diffusion facilitator family transporter
MAVNNAESTEQLVGRGLKSSLVGIGMNLVLALSKCSAGFLGHSFALVADGIESLSDVVSSSVVYFGLKVAIKPPDEEHPYGHGKAEPIAAIIVSLALVAAAILIGAGSIKRIRTPHPLPEPYTLWVLLAVVALKILLSRYVSSVGEKIDSSAVRNDAWHHLSDAITSGFAFIGISIALWIKNPTADDWAALCAAPIILFNACRQLRHPLGELLDESPGPQMEQEVRAAASGNPHVIGIEKCHVRKVGFRFYVDLHLVVNGALTVREGHNIAHEVKAHILETIPRVAEVLVHVEPEEELLAAAHN